MGALEFACPIRTVGFPPVEEGKSAKLLTFRKGINEADARVRTVNGLLLALEAIVDDVGTL